MNWPMRSAETIVTAPSLFPPTLIACPFHFPVYNIQSNNCGSTMFGIGGAGMYVFFFC